MLQSFMFWLADYAIPSTVSYLEIQWVPSARNVEVTEAKQGTLVLTSNCEESPGSSDLPP
jgi:hypothetical protein